MNHFYSKQCIYCGSTLVNRGSKPHCTGDNLHITKRVFDNILSLEEDQSKFEDRLVSLQQNELVFDLFIQYWNYKKKDPTVNLNCLHEESYYRAIPKGEPKLPMPEQNIPFPDLAEVYIAEIMLGRELTPFEKDGRRHIPKIDQSTGEDYLAPLTWVRYPIDYICLKDMNTKTDYRESRLVPVFDIVQIRGLYEGRDGDLIDG